MPDRPRLLFVGTTDAARCRLAKAILRDRVGERLMVHGVGLRAGEPQPELKTVLAEIGCTPSPSSPRTLAELPDVGFDLVVTLCDHAREVCLSPDLPPSGGRRALFGGLPVHLHWPLANPAEVPAERRLEAYREARDHLVGHVDGLIGLGYLDALLLERERLQRFADMLDAGVLVQDESRGICLVNRSFQEITGHARKDLIGRDGREVFTDSGFFPGPEEAPDGRLERRLPFTDTSGRTRQLKLTTEPIEVEPGKPGRVLAVHDESEVNRLRHQLRQRGRFHGMVGVCPAIQELFASIEMVGGSDYPVLISGESGTGKELAAAAVHAESRRVKGPFVPVNCGALPENLIESELFGHVRGAFTGAIRDKKGRFELAAGGTLFLDEVGELSMPIQVKLLRVLQEKRIERVGGERTIPVDVRIISATNRDLLRMVREGAFREDLYYRLCVVPLVLPPLRERREDIPFLVDHILDLINRETGGAFGRPDDRALDLMLLHDWPGNIRELVNALQFASVRCDDRTIRPEHLPPEIRRTDGGSVGLRHEAAVRPQAPARKRVRLTPETVAQALSRSGDNKSQAAKLLGVGRATLYRFLDRQKT